MIYGLLADGVVLFHFLWILFLIFGGFWGRKYRPVRYIHIPAVLFAWMVEVFDWYCPLTHVEVWLRSRQYPAGGYSGSFITHYLERVIYLDLPRGFIIFLAFLLIAMNCLLYLRRGNQRSMP
jgi:hypothetical protein